MPLNKTFRKKRFKLQCSPHSRKHKKLKNTCYTNDSLIHLKNIWNKRNTYDKIRTRNPKKILYEFHKRLDKSCKHEKCWLENNILKYNLTDEIKNHTFAPFQQKSWITKKDTWLDSNDIKNIMKQYEYEYDDFVFIGPSPVDYDYKLYKNECVWNDLCNFSLYDHTKIKHNNLIGIIFNLDTHEGPGTHWVSLFINIKHSYIVYFDSNGVKPPSNIIKFINFVQSQSIKIFGRKLKLYVNTTRHQKSNTECGMFSLYCMINMIRMNYNQMKSFCNHRIPDEKMLQLRNILFNPAIYDQ